MFPWKSKLAAARLLLCCALAVSLPAQDAPVGAPAPPAASAAAGAAAAEDAPSPLANPGMRRVGDHLRCLCGCKATVTGCDMMQCRYASPARAQIASMLAKGEPENAILSWFAKQNGLSALMAPPAEGFYAVGWVMPFIGLLFGFIIVYYFLRRYRQPAPPAAAGAPAPLPPQVLDRYRAQIDRDLAHMDE